MYFIETFRSGHQILIPSPFYKFMTYEDASLAISIITTVIGIIGGSFAVMTYLKNQRLQRQAIILPLMEDFDTDERLDVARKLLDDFVISIEGGIIPGRELRKTISVSFYTFHTLDIVVVIFLLWLTSNLV